MSFQADTLLRDAMTEMKQSDKSLLKEAEEACNRGGDELNKAVQVLESMEKVKQQIECLCRILRKPDN